MQKCDVCVHMSICVINQHVCVVGEHVQEPNKDAAWSP